MPEVVVLKHETNGLGLAGLVFSCLGWVTCGLLSFPGVLFSLLGLLNRPRGTAIAGLLVGLPGSVFFLVSGMAMVLGLIGLNEQIQVEAERLQADRATNAVTELTPDTKPDTVPEL